MKDAVDIREGKKFAKVLEKAGKEVNLVAGDQQAHTMGYFPFRCNQCKAGFKAEIALRAHKSSIYNDQLRIWRVAI